MFDPGTSAPCMTTSEGKAVALRGVHGDMKINDLFMETILEQTYENIEQDNIETVYTFAVPMDAVLLGLTVNIGDQEMKGTVLEKEQAEQLYEDALVDGDSASLLEQAGEGLMTMNVGNLMPGETARVQLRFGQLLRFQDDQVRIHLPLTIAPRYGDPAKAGLADHQQFEHTLEDFAGFSLNVTIKGLLAKSQVNCPSHEVIQNMLDDVLHIRLAREQAPLDRDFILSMKTDSFSGAFAHQGQDHDGSVIIAGFRPACPDNVQTKPVNVKILVDCSGSMSGDSMVQARKGLKMVLDALRPEDRFSLTTFGSSWRHHHPALVQATKTNISKAHGILKKMDADMGGTELGHALEAVYSLPVDRESSADILLITDGEVYAGDQLTRKARASDHRIFTVGVGSSVSEATVRGLADSTGGVCELVSPNEDMAERIHRHFLRMTRPQAVIKSLTWPASPKSQIPANPKVFAGDTLFVAAFMDRQTQGQVALELDWGLDVPARMIAEVQDADQSQATDQQAPATIARMAASMLLKETDDPDKARELSLRYQLVGEHTSYLLVLVREDGEKAKTLPVLRKVPHTLAAGWGGAGSAMTYMPRRRSTGVSMSCCYVPRSKFTPSRSTVMNDYIPINSEMNSNFYNDTQWDNIASCINSWLDEYKPIESINLDISELESIGISKKIISDLKTLNKEGYEMKIIVISFLMIIAEVIEADSLSRQAKRVISWYSKHYSPGNVLLEKVQQILDIMILLDD